MPKVPVSDKRTGYGIDYAEPKTKPVSVLPEIPPSVQPSEQVQTKSIESVKQISKSEPARQKPVENKDPSKSQPRSVVSQPKTTPADQATNNPQSAKQAPLSVPQQKAILNNVKTPADRMMGASEIIENRESNIPYGVEKSKSLNETAGAKAKPLTKDDRKNSEKTPQQVAEEKMQNQQQKADTSKTMQQKTQQPEEVEQKTKIKKMDLNKEKWWKSKDKWWESKNGKKMQTQKDPFANDKSLDSKYERKTTSSGSRSHNGVASYGGDSDIAMQKQAIANKQARIAREQAQADEDAAFFAGALTNAMMNATINATTKSSSKRSSGGGAATAASYDDYSPDDDYTYTTPHSATFNQAKKMTGGGGW